MQIYSEGTEQKQTYMFINVYCIKSLSSVIDSINVMCFGS